mmetsp:Transcript_26882/g.57349  ORF Transcript_26882/g.57349 Transcript_26882/m.57349 type:complete len:223 (+) Transcript_26882:1838-2506(+)
MIWMVWIGAWISCDDVSHPTMTRRKWRCCCCYRMKRKNSQTTTTNTISTSSVSSACGCGCDRGGVSPSDDRETICRRFFGRAFSRKSCVCVGDGCGLCRRCFLRRDCHNWFPIPRPLWRAPSPFCHRHDCDRNDWGYDCVLFDCSVSLYVRCRLCRHCRRRRRGRLCRGVVPGLVPGRGRRGCDCGCVADGFHCVRFLLHRESDLLLVHDLAGGWEGTKTTP